METFQKHVWFCIVGIHSMSAYVGSSGDNRLKIKRQAQYLSGCLCKYNCIRHVHMVRSMPAKARNDTGINNKCMCVASCKTTDRKTRILEMRAYKVAHCLLFRSPGTPGRCGCCHETCEWYERHHARLSMRALRDCIWEVA